jgi:hypothetical protein
MSKLFNFGWRARMFAFSVASAAFALVASGLAGATEDPALTSASSTVTSYFTTNLPVAIGAFVTVCGVLWLLSLIFRSVGIHRRRSVG